MQKPVRTGGRKTAQALRAFAAQLQREPRAAHLIPALVAARGHLETALDEHEARTEAQTEATARVERSQEAVVEGIRQTDLHWAPVTGRRPDARTTRLFPLAAGEMVRAPRNRLRAHGRALVETIETNPEFEVLKPQAAELRAALDALDASLADQKVATEATVRARLQMNAVKAESQAAYSLAQAQLVVLFHDLPGRAESLCPRLRRAKKVVAPTTQVEARPQEPPGADDTTG